MTTDQRVQDAYDAIETQPRAEFVETLAGSLRHDYDDVAEMDDEPGRISPLTRHVLVGSIAAVLAGVVVAGALVARTPGSRGTVRPPVASTPTTNTGAATAAVLVQQLLDKATVPGDATPLATSPTKVLDQPQYQEVADTQSDGTRFYDVPVPPVPLSDTLQGQQPQGLEQYGSGFGSDGVHELTFSPTDPLPGQIASANVNYSFVANGIARSYVRVDVIVVWRPERPADEIVPARDAVALISSDSFTDPTRPNEFPMPNATPIEDPAQFASLVQAFDSAPTAITGAVMHCPMDNGLVYTLAFATSRTSVPDLVVTVHASGCQGAAVEVNGQPSAPLVGSGIVDAIKAVMNPH